MMRRLQEEKQRHAATCEILKATALCFNCANRMMEERSLLILGQQEHEQLLDEEISQLKTLLQGKERELQHAHSLLKGAATRVPQQLQQQQPYNHHHPRADMDIVERLESLEQEVGHLKRRTPTLAELKCANPRSREDCTRDAPAETILYPLEDHAGAAREMQQHRHQLQLQQLRQDKDKSAWVQCCIAMQFSLN